MADTKTTDLAAFTPVLTDIVYGVDDPGGTPAPGKITLEALNTLFGANITVGATSQVTGLDAALSGKATAAQGAKADSAVQPGDPVSINAQTGTAYTLVLADAGKIVSMSNASANTLTIPTNAAVALPVGTVINVTQLGAGTTTIKGDTGVTVNGTSAGSEAISAQYKSASLVKHAADTWVVEGSLA